jgi:hypothetical protein
MKYGIGSVFGQAKIGKEPKKNPITLISQRRRRSKFFRNQ